MLEASGRLWDLKFMRAWNYSCCYCCERGQSNDDGSFAFHVARDVEMITLVSDAWFLQKLVDVDMSWMEVFLAYTMNYMKSMEQH